MVNQHVRSIEQMLFSSEAQLCTRREWKTFRPQRPSSVAMHRVRVMLSYSYTHINILRLSIDSLRVHSCASMLNNICSESMSAARMSLYYILRSQSTQNQATPACETHLDYLDYSVSTRLIIMKGKVAHKLT